MKMDYEFFAKAADFIRARIGDFRPEIGLILGSGLGAFSGRIEAVCEIPYTEIPNFLVSTAPGHAGRLIFGTVEGRRVVCMSGRFHFYEGYDLEQLTIPVRVMKLLGVRSLVLTNAAGAINESYHVGDVMIIKDHVKLSPLSPLRGPNLEKFGERFFDMGDAYSKELRRIAREAAEAVGPEGPCVREGVYFFFGGPQFETPAEIRMARILGGDAAGMSTVPEVITAAHCRLPVLGLSLMTNMAAGVLPQPLSGEEVNAAAEAARPKLERYFSEVLRRLP